MFETRTLDLQQLDPRRTNLIEASAGTGKTWTITRLYLRLILEHDWQPEQILVVTFTNDATAELKQRIRLLLQELRQHLDSGTEDEFLAGLIEAGHSIEQLRKRLHTALRQFDDAAIHTIHGFCQRVLSEHAFASAQSLVRELGGDDGELLHQVTADFWRRHLPAAPALLVPHLLRQYRGEGPAGLARRLRPWLGRPYLKVDRQQMPDLQACSADLDHAYRDMTRLWQQHHQALIEFLIESKHLKHQSFSKRNVPRWADQAAAWVAAGTWSLDADVRFFEHLVPEKVQLHLKGPCDLSDYLPLLQAIATMRDSVASAQAGIEAAAAVFFADALVEVEAAMQQRKQQLRLVSFNDLLLDLDSALQGAGAERLLSALRQQFRIALIDEFQDTDPLQYGIFRRIFTAAGLPMTLVGDPKQAIYSFRGADVFAYLQARQQADVVHTMDTNWRAVPELVTALNRLFAGRHDLFHSASIKYQQMQASRRSHQRLLLDGSPVRPLRFVHLQPTDDTRMSKTVAIERSLLDSARQIAVMLQQSRAGRLTLETATGEPRPVQPGDIAVLLRSHHQAGLVQQYLGRVGVASVRQARENVFTSEQAVELQRLLQAMAEPLRSTTLKTALATRLAGLTAAELLALQSDDAAWQERVEQFHRYHLIWHQQGMMPALWSCLAELKIPPRLLQSEGGERALTNLLHLAELLQQQAREAHLDMQATLTWLQQQRFEPSPNNDAALLRLESDDDRVQVMTVHVSKGLEFPLVFCPLLWHASDYTPGDAILWHDPEDHDQAHLSVSAHPDEETVEQARREESAEQMRLAYVALTRASRFCAVTVAEVEGLERAPLHWWLDPENQAADWAQRLSPLLEQQSDCIEMIPAMSESQAAELDTQQKPPVVRQARPFNGQVPARRQLTSFSALHAGHNPDIPDYDQSSDTRGEVSSGIHAFPRGARSGRCLHAIYEFLDFTSPDRAALQQLVCRQLQAHGFDPGWQEIVSANVEAVLETPLDSNSGVSLSAVASNHRLNELEFHFPIPATSLQAFRDVLQQVLPASDLPVMPALSGYMKGFIDLVFEHQGRFYLVDYKSNWLGPDTAAYGQAAMHEAMRREGYQLQYLIYIVALHRLLRLRVPGYEYERHFGGVRYLFLRGMEGSGGSHGVYADKPEATLIARLDHALGSN